MNLASPDKTTRAEWGCPTTAEAHCHRTAELTTWLHRYRWHWTDANLKAQTLIRHPVLPKGQRIEALHIEDGDVNQGAERTRRRCPQLAGRS